MYRQVEAFLRPRIRQTLESQRVPLPIWELLSAVVREVCLISVNCWVIPPSWTWRLKLCKIRTCKTWWQTSCPAHWTQDSNNHHRPTRRPRRRHPKAKASAETRLLAASTSTISSGRKYKIEKKHWLSQWLKLTTRSCDCCVWELFYLYVNICFAVDNNSLGKCRWTTDLLLTSYDGKSSHEV